MQVEIQFGERKKASVFVFIFNYIYKAALTAVTRVSHPHQQKEANYKDCKDRLQETGSSGATVKIKARGHSAALTNVKQAVVL